MFPSLLAEELQDVLTAYLGTTFALAEDNARRTLERFLSDPESGLFRGPFLRLRPPFRPADDTWQEPLAWAPRGFRPYRHQALAFERLSSLRNDPPCPTIVTTGTGSGKTESFLVPILDHCARARANGQPGVKALILYPMNALANDQAGRLAALIEENRDELNGVTAGLYTGDSGDTRSMSATRVIENRESLRRQPPDILLTNYKMLDRLLLRQLDAGLWEGAAESLQYLVLDEFHTYDGAQGTDVALLLRRLGIRLTLARPGEPLGRVTPVATSATLGEGSRPDELLRFASTVFGRPFDADTLIREDRLSAAEWAGPPGVTGKIPLLDEVTAVLSGCDSHQDRVRAAAVLFAEDGHAPDPDDHAALGEFLRAHPLTVALVEATGEPERPEEVLGRLAGVAPSWASAVAGGRATEARVALAAFLALLSWARAQGDTPLLHLEAQLWVREVTHVLRGLHEVPTFRWHDDGPRHDEPETQLPAVYCRHCGRAGWGAVLRPGSDHTLDPKVEHAWAASVRKDKRFRALLHAPAEALAGQDTIRWLDPGTVELHDRPPAADSPEEVLPVLVTPSGEAAGKQTCPSCGREDGIRFIGSRVSTLTSVVLGHVFGHDDVEPEQKKTLVFTDSVQDAAHRAGFVEARAYTFNLRSLLHRAIRSGGVRLDQVAGNLVADATDPAERYALLPPALTDRKGFAPFWQTRRPPQTVNRRVEQRMSFATHLEFGLNSQTGRTLERTGSVVVQVDAGGRTKLDRLARTVIEQHGPADLVLPAGVTQNPVAWVRGMLERIRTRGAIDHPWLREYIQRDGSRWPIFGGRRRSEGMPAFPPGRPAPAFPTTLAKSEPFDSVVATRTWFTWWTGRCLGVPEPDAPRLVRGLFEALCQDDVLLSFTTKENATVYALAAERILLERTEDEAPNSVLGCDVCATTVPTGREITDQLEGAPCLRWGCLGRLRPSPVTPDYYRSLYRAEHVRRIVAEEHTGLLDRERRTAVERAFKSGDAPNSPNVLACTPTLELGIDIGDLDAVTLTSLPRSTAAYLQRVGRAGRRTGNALVVAVLPGRAAELHHLADPLQMISGQVVPPACYLDAIEILRRQYLAALVDRTASSGKKQPEKARELLRGGLDSGTWLRRLLDDARDHASAYLDEFLATLDGQLLPATAEALRGWAGAGTRDDEVPPMESAVRTALDRWEREMRELAERISGLDEEHDRLGDDDSLSTEEARIDRRRVAGELSAVRKMRAHREGEYWLSALESLGLLPNYTLLDDTTSLDVGLWWTDEETGDHKVEDASFERGSRLALHELAPGNTFYVRRLALRIDAVDVGSAHSPTTLRWRCCPSCGWSGQDGEARVVSACPRCRDGRIADTGQRLDVAPFRRASAFASRDEARFGDEREEREQQRFVVAVAGDVDPADVTARWTLGDYPFGVEVCRQIAIRWLNLGQADRGGRELRIAGETLTAPLFHTCRHCGVVPSAQNKEPSEARHRGWCPQRRGFDRHGWTDLALLHELRTEAVRVVVPPVVMADDIQLVSFTAALRLGLRGLLGGDPDHLDAFPASEPGNGGRLDLVVLHDRVPGGTGYLARFADPAQMRALLDSAEQVLASCPCAEEGLGCCHRCLLPLVHGDLVPLARRDRALEMIRELLDNWRPGPSRSGRDWVVVDPAETPIERRFRALLTRWAKQNRAQPRTSAGTHGDRLTFTVQAGDHNRTWIVEAQVPLGGVRPDFLLHTEDPAVPDIAVFCDSVTYHASPVHNRTAADAEKRAGLRARGMLVWAVTHADLTRFEAALDGAVPSGLPFLTQQQLTAFHQASTRVAGAGGVRAEEVRGDAMDLLAAFLVAPQPCTWHSVAQAVAGGLMAAAGKSGATVVGPTQLPEAVRRHGLGRFDELRREVQSGAERRAALPTHTSAGTPILLLPVRMPRIDLVMVLDDSDSVVGGPEHEARWRDWLAASNLLQFLDEDGETRFAAVTTASPLRPEDLPAPGRNVRKPDRAWRETIDVADPRCRSLLLELADLGVPLPEPGMDGPDNDWQIDLAWPDHRLAVLVGDSADRAGVLREYGWVVLDPERVGLVDEIAQRTGKAN